MTRTGSAPVREGDLLAGKYRVDRVLGAGGMGIVVAAKHEQLDQMVAIKFVRDEALDNEEAVQRFLREARAAVKLKSEHVARVLDVGKLDSGAPYMVMEYLEGDDLAKVLADHGPMDFESAANCLLQACEAVAEAHAAGIVHRDLKPENLFLTSTIGGTQKIKVLDFGVSKAMDSSSGGAMSSLTRTRAMLGSPLYMAPEQMRSSRDVDARADVWALGVVLFQLLTQRWPFEAETMPELCLRVVTEPPTSLLALRPDAPPRLVAVIERCVEKDASKRFANAAELATALEEFAPAESRILAERARLAMEPRVAGPRTTSRLSRPMDRVTTPGATQRTAPAATLHSGATPVTPGRATPSTSAAWGHERVVTALAPPLRPRRPLAVVLGAIVVGVGGLAALAFALHAPGPNATAASAGGGYASTTPGAGAGTLDAVPPSAGAPAIAGPRPVPAPATSLAAERDPSPSMAAPAPKASETAPPSPSSAVLRPGPTSFSPGKPAVPNPRPSGKPGHDGPNGTGQPGDDDIPTIR
jgi:serine/threonine-protein kinase